MDKTKFNRTKIVATIGPATSNLETIISLINAGADVFRLNTSHGSTQEHEDSIRNIRKAALETNQHIAIILDLQGPKLRVGILDHPITLVDNTIYSFAFGEQSALQEVIPIDADIFNDLTIGEKILINDGRLELEITETSSTQFKAKVIVGGELTSRKGINVPSATLSIPCLTEKDIEFMKFGIEQNVDYIALSFVRNKEDIRKAKQILESHNATIPLIAKIEKPQAVDNIDQILQEADGIMVARGDLGVEMGPENVPLTQKMLINKANLANKPVIVATQMLESMVYDPIPTRAEANDVANAILDGTDAIMLSDETTIGKFPLRAVEMMNKIAQVVENNPLYNNIYNSFLEEKYCSDNRFSDIKINRLFNEIDIQAIVAFTESGQTALTLSKSRVMPPIIAFCNNAQVCNRLNLVWGVIPILYKGRLSIQNDDMTEVCESLLSQTFLTPGAKVMYISGLPYFSLGKTTSFKYYIL